MTPTSAAKFLLAHAGSLWSGTALCSDTLWLATRLNPQLAKAALALLLSLFPASATAAPSAPGPLLSFLLSSAITPFLGCAGSPPTQSKPCL